MDDFLEYQEHISCYCTRFWIVYFTLPVTVFLPTSFYTMFHVYCPYTTLYSWVRSRRRCLQVCFLGRKIKKVNTDESNTKSIGFQRERQICIHYIEWLYCSSVQYKNTTLNLKTITRLLARKQEIHVKILKKILVKFWT